MAARHNLPTFSPVGWEASPFLPRSERLMLEENASQRLDFFTGESDLLMGNTCLNAPWLTLASHHLLCVCVCVCEQQHALGLLQSSSFPLSAALPTSVPFTVFPVIVSDVNMQTHLCCNTFMHTHTPSWGQMLKMTPLSPSGCYKKQTLHPPRLPRPRLMALHNERDVSIVSSHNSKRR